MARHIPLTLDYIVFQTQYTNRIAQKRDKLYDEIAENELENVEPLYTYDTLWGSGQDLLTDDPDLTEITSLRQAVHDVLGDSDSGTVAFRADSIPLIFRLYHVLRETGYCNMYSIDDIKFVDATILDRPVKIAIVDVDSESG